MTLAVEAAPLSGHGFGAEIAGIDPRAIGAVAFAAIHRAWTGVDIICRVRAKEPSPQNGSPQRHNR